MKKTPSGQTERNIIFLNHTRLEKNKGKRGRTRSDKRWKEVNEDTRERRWRMHSLSKCHRVHVFREVILKKQLEAGNMTVALHFFDNTLNLFMTSGVTFNVVIGPAASRKSSKAHRGSRNSFPQLFPSFRFNNRYEVFGAAKICELFHGPEASQLVVLSGKRLVRGVASDNYQGGAKCSNFSTYFRVVSISFEFHGAKRRAVKRLIF